MKMQFGDIKVGQKFCSAKGNYYYKILLEERNNAISELGVLCFWADDTVVYIKDNACKFEDILYGKKFIYDGKEYMKTMGNCIMIQDGYIHFLQLDNDEKVERVDS